LRQNVMALPFTFTHVANEGKAAALPAAPRPVSAVAVCAGAARSMPDLPNTAPPASPTVLLVVTLIFDVLPFVCNYHKESSSLSATFFSTTESPQSFRTSSLSARDPMEG
jgi:hypothetical protein